MISQIQNLQIIYKSEYQFYTNTDIYFNYLEANTHKIEKFIITDRIRKAYTTRHAIFPYKLFTYILTTINTLLIYIDKNFTTVAKIINNVTDLGQNYVCINKKYYVFDSRKGTFNDDDFILTNNIINSSLYEYPFYDIMLINNEIAYSTKNGKFITFAHQYPIKRIMGDRNAVFVVKK